MKKFLLFLFMVSSMSLKAQNTDYLITMNGIGALKLSMKQTDVEKLLNKKFTLKNMLEKDGSYMDTTRARYKNTDITLYFEREYQNENNFHMVLSGMMVSNPCDSE